MSGSSRKAPPDEAQKVGDYILGDEIGRGSFAVVYRGRHKTNGGMVAVKAVQRSKLTKKLLENLESEIAILKGIQHDHIVELLEWRNGDNVIHLVMEFCSLGDLSGYIRRNRASSGGSGSAVLGLPEATVKHFLRQLASAIEFLRTMNVVHRDIKPQNLLLQPATKQSEAKLKSDLPVLKVADFGFARLLPSHSLAETLCGSPLYMAPEILAYEKYDAKADLWSVGTVLYEMIVGRPPFRAQNHLELLKKIEKNNDRIRFPDEEPSGNVYASFRPISDELKDLIRKLLKRNPVARISFEEFFLHPFVVKDTIGAPAVEERETAPKRLQVTPSSTSITTGAQKAAASAGISTGAGIGTVASSGRNEEVAISAPPASTPLVSNSEHPPFALLSTGSGSTGRSYPLTPQESASRNPRRSEMDPPFAMYTMEDRNFTRESSQQSEPIQQRSRNAPIPMYLDNRYSNGEGRTSGGAELMSSSAQTFPSPDLGAPPFAHSPTSSPSNAFKSSTRERAERERKRNSTASQTSASDMRRVEDDIIVAREYVVIEKRAVEVNALADELAASPSTTTPSRPSSFDSGQTGQGAIVGSTPPTHTAISSTTGPVAMIRGRSTSTASGSPLDLVGTPPPFARQPSWPRSGPSATSALARALSMASARLFGAGVSPPQSAPFVGAMHFGESNDEEENSVVRELEDIYEKAVAVMLLADTKLPFLLPQTPQSSTIAQWLQASLQSAPTFPSPAEAAFLLYLKSLALLQYGMSVAKSYWENMRIRRGRIASVRVNNIVQLIRDRFNECLERAEIAKSRCDPSSSPASESETCGMVEKILYESALDMSRVAAMNEMTGQLSGCERAYEMALGLLKAILDEAGREEDYPLEEKDRRVVNKFIGSIMIRLGQLRKKLAELQAYE
ncbi:uncharacterized protein VTP21DRAFT_5624 [Calcarisporiella thermophila]|uniref:uncharacterized protein n=1 Tax=Calcarisporiella thermophila TaxID=911321 RepID=UPI00374366EE